MKKRKTKPNPFEELSAKFHQYFDDIEDPTQYVRDMRDGKDFYPMSQNDEQTLREAVADSSDLIDSAIDAFANEEK